MITWRGRTNIKWECGLQRSWFKTMQCRWNHGGDRIPPPSFWEKYNIDYTIKTSSFKRNWIFPPDFYIFLRSCLKILGHGYKKILRSSYLIGKGEGFIHIKLRTKEWPSESFFFLKSQTLDRQIGPKFFGAFGVFSADLSVPILVLWVPCPCFPLNNHYFYRKLLSGT